MAYEKRWGKDAKEKPCEDRSRVWRDATTSCEAPGATRSRRGKGGFSPRVFGGIAALPTP